MPSAGQVRSSAEKLAARIADCGHTAPDSSSSSRAALYTPHPTGRREFLYYDVVMLSALLGCNVWQYGELQSIAVLVWCCKARGWGGVQAGWGQHSEPCGDSAALLLAAAARCSQLLHRHQSTSAPPPAHSSSSRTANSLQIWVSDRRTAPQPRTPPVQKPCKAAPHSATLAASRHTTPDRDTEDFCDRWRWLVTLRDTRYNCDDDVTELQPAPPPSYHAVRNQVTSAN